MSIAPLAKIVTAPVPTDTGVTLTVDTDTGVRFPIPPFARFTALIFSTNQVGPLVRGENCEEVVVLDRVGDDFSIERAEDGRRIDISAGMNIALLRRTPVYALGETVTLYEVFDVDAPPYTLALLSPSGELGGFGSATGVDATGNGSVEFSFTPDRPGLWHFRWDNAAQVLGDEEFFVEFGQTMVI